MTILAPGLLGASLAEAAHKRGVVERIHVWARREETRVQCREKNWCFEAYEDPRDACSSAELIWICSPVNTIARLLSTVSPVLKSGAIVSDVGSTKASVVEQCQRAVGIYAEFVGSHPMAGSEKSGLEFSDPKLFEDRPCFVTPSESNTRFAVSKVSGFWNSLGMKVDEVSPRDHDRIVAFISHLPHLSAVSLCNVLREVGNGDWSQFISSGFLDTTRVAAGSPEMWMSIIEHNRELLLESIHKMKTDLEHLSAHLEGGRYEAVREWLEIGKEFRDSLK